MTAKKPGKLVENQLTTTGPKTPSLRLHATGQWMTKLNGRTVYFGKDRKTAESRFVKALADWRKESGIVAGLTVAEAVEGLKVHVEGELGKEGRQYHDFALKPLCEKFGALAIADLDTEHLFELRADLIGRDWKPKTINHCLTATKRLVRYSAARKWRTALEMSEIKAVACPAPMPKHFSLEELVGIFEACENNNPAVGVWAKLQYLTAARPSEVVRLCQGEGREIEPGIFCFSKSKTARSLKHPRCLALSSHARRLFEQVEPRWSSFMTYGKALENACGHRPHRLRHSSAHAIHRLRVNGEKVDRETTDICLGHMPGYVSLVYNPVDWEPILAAFGADTPASAL